MVSCPAGVRRALTCVTYNLESTFGGEDRYDNPDQQIRPALLLGNNIGRFLCVHRLIGTINYAAYVIRCQSQ